MGINSILKYQTLIDEGGIPAEILYNRITSSNTSMPIDNILSDLCLEYLGITFEDFFAISCPFVFNLSK